MTIEKIREAMHQQPFISFLVRIVEGQVYEVRERSATTESGAASGQRMPFPDYVSAQGPVPIPWTQVDPVCFLSTPSSRTG